MNHDPFAPDPKPTPEPVQVADRDGGNRTGPAWEQPGHVGSLRAFFFTIVAILLRPRTTFRSMNVSRGTGKAFLFALGAYYVSILLLVLLSREHTLSMLSMFGSNAVRMTALFMIPLLLAPFLYVGAFAYHVMLILLRANRHGFAATFRVLAYVSGSTNVFFALLGAIPYLGVVLQMLWITYLQIVGLSNIHEITIGRAILAVVLAFAVPVLLVVLLVALLLGGFGQLPDASRVMEV